MSLWFVEQFRLGRMVIFKHLPEDLPPEAAKEKQFCIAQGMKSNLTIPLLAGGAVLGALTFAFLRRTCELDEGIITRIKLVGEIFANVLLRKRRAIAGTSSKAVSCPTGGSRRR